MIYYIIHVIITNIRLTSYVMYKLGIAAIVWLNFLVSVNETYYS